MSLGHKFHCSQCSFQFFSGWSHHEGGSSLLCRHCGERFIARSERSVWGPSANERLPIYHERRISKRKGMVREDTGLFLTAFESSDQRGLIRTKPDTLCCPCCQTDGSVSGTMSAGDACPKCHAATSIIDDGLVEY